MASAAVPSGRRVSPAAAREVIMDVDSGIDWGYLWDLGRAILLGEFIIIGPALWVFVGILGAFLVTRGITRFIRHRANNGGAPSGPIRDITIRGVHIHHQVFGIVTMFLAGLLIIATGADGTLLNLLALLFGIGVGLAFDEFALWLHLDDVYWSHQGRKSVDAVAWALVVTASVRAVLDLFTVFEGVREGGELWWLPVLITALTVIPAVICVLKGKLVTASLGIVYQPIGLIGAFRLAKPGSIWARHLYGATSRRRRRSDSRFDHRYQARWDRWRDLVAGAPTEHGERGAIERAGDVADHSTER
jgi:hypothetical protein